MVLTSDRQVRITAVDARIFVFGDSLSDIGNIFNLFERRNPPSPPYFEGRFSNGRVAVEVLADRLGYRVNRASNFAVGGATTGRENVGDTPLLRIGGLQNQIDRFSTLVGSRGANPRALYFVWAGSNDLFNPAVDPTTAVNQAAANIRTAVTRLANLGAKNIVVVQNPNLGRVPLSRQTGRLDSLANSTQRLNNQLRSQLTPLERTLDINVILGDLFPLGEAIAQDPDGFGFVNVVDPFLQGLTPIDPSINPNRFFFWDQTHPTARGHALFANPLREAVITEIKDPIQRIGTVRDDVLIGFAGNDSIAGLAGQDRIEGNGGDDTLLGGIGDDNLLGQADQDLILGGVGNDSLQGGTGNDRLFGEAGQDTLSGGAGIDFLSGGFGDDLLNGGGNCDLFSLRLRGGVDTIQDFDTTSDILVLTGNVSFDQLAFRQEGANTRIAIASTNQSIAILENVRATSIDSTDFLNPRNIRLVFDLANTQQGQAILDAIRAESAGTNTLLPTR